jgi:hypothetical protein
MCFKGIIASIPDEERNASVPALLEIVRIMQEQMQELKDEIARLKGLDGCRELWPTEKGDHVSQSRNSG